MGCGNGGEEEEARMYLAMDSQGRVRLTKELEQCWPASSRGARERVDGGGGRRGELGRDKGRCLQQRLQVLLLVLLLLAL